MIGGPHDTEAWQMWNQALNAHLLGTTTELPATNLYKEFVIRHEWGTHRRKLTACPICQNKPGANHGMVQQS